MAENKPKPSAAEGDASEVTLLRQELAEQRRATTAVMEKMAAIMERLALGERPGATVEKMMAEEMLEKKRQEEWFEAEHRYITLPNNRRSQIEVNRRYKDGDRLFYLRVGWIPPLVVRGHDQTQAKARYEEACGIQWIRRDEARPDRTEYTIVEVTGVPQARELCGIDRERALAEVPGTASELTSLEESIALTATATATAAHRNPARPRVA